MEHWIRINPDDPPNRYQFPDPTTERFDNAAHQARYYPGNITRDEGFQLAEAAEAYHHIMTHPMGTEEVIKQIRAIRRALHEAKKGGS